MDRMVRQAAGPEDDERSLAIYNEVWPRAAVAMAEVDSYKGSVRAWADFLALIDDEAVGSAFVAIEPSRPDIGSLSLTVLTPFRGRGAGSALYREVSAWCAGQGIKVVETPIEVDEPASIEFAMKRGFTEVERYGRMVLELDDLDPAPVAPPAGIEIVTWAERPELSRGIYEVAVEAYPDMPGNENDEIEPYEDWLVHDMQGSADRPEATFVALAGSEVVGYAKFFLTAARPTEAFHDTTGVKRAWRGKGLAGALKRTQIAWAKQEGFERLVTGNEMRNEPIRRLNANLGYQAAPGRVLMRGPLFDALGRAIH
jgi:GNAT superfamily N-acetyltransferase